MGRVLAAALIVMAVLASASRALAEDIYKWTDEQGRTHYSNRGASSGNDSSAALAEPGGQGWESILEKHQGTADFQEKSEAAINSLELQMMRRKRDRTQAQEQLEATQAGIVRASSTNPTDLPNLRAREATQITELRRIDAEIMTMEMNIARIRAFRTADKDQRSTR